LASAWLEVGPVRKKKAQIAANLKTISQDGAMSAMPIRAMVKAEVSVTLAA
jgi:hypothetical protein